MPLRNIRNLLSASGELAALREKTQRLLALQRAYVDCTPVELAELTQASRVGYLRAGTLYLLADNATVAAKLRQLLPRLLPVFRKLEPEVTGIRVDVQPRSPPAAPTPKSEEKSQSIDLIDKLISMPNSIRDPALKSAIAHLIQHRIKKQ